MTDTMAEETERAAMSSAAVNDLPDSAFAYIEPGGSKDASGKTTPRSKRHFPIHDAAHVRNALAQLSKADPAIAKEARPKIEAAAKKMGIGEPAKRADVEPQPARPLPPLGLELIRFTGEYRILTRADGYGDGRTVEAVITPFNVETPIHDVQGQYRELITPGAFDRILSKVRPQASRSYWNTRVLFNHGMTVHGTPSESGSMPIGVPLDVRNDPIGLIGTYRVRGGDQGDAVLELLEAGQLGHSFTGRIMRSDPEPTSRLGGYRPGPGGQLPLVKRLELGLREWGPTPFPAYEDTGVLGVRSIDLSDAQEGSPDDDDQSDAPDGSPDDPGGTPSDDGLATGALPDPGVEHAARSDPDRDVHHASFVTELRMRCRARGF